MDYNQNLQNIKQKEDQDREEKLIGQQDLSNE